LQPVQNAIMRIRQEKWNVVGVKVNFDHPPQWRGFSAPSSTLHFNLNDFKTQQTFSFFKTRMISLFSSIHLVVTEWFKFFLTYMYNHINKFRCVMKAITQSFITGTFYFLCFFVYVCSFPLFSSHGVSFFFLNKIYNNNNT